MTKSYSWRYPPIAFMCIGERRQPYICRNNINTVTALMLYSTRMKDIDNVLSYLL